MMAKEFIKYSTVCLARAVMTMGNYSRFLSSEDLGGLNKRGDQINWTFLKSQN